MHISCFSLNKMYCSYMCLRRTYPIFTNSDNNGALMHRGKKKDVSLCGIMLSLLYSPLLTVLSVNLWTCKHMNFCFFVIVCRFYVLSSVQIIFMTFHMNIYHADVYIVPSVWKWNQDFPPQALKKLSDTWCWICVFHGFDWAKEPTPVVMFDTSPNTHHY